MRRGVGEHVHLAVKQVLALLDLVGPGLAERMGFASLLVTNRSQAVRLPKEYQFSTADVFIRKEGEDVILSPRPRDWRPYLETAPVASDTFMNDIEDLPVQEREG